MKVYSGFYVYPYKSELKGKIYPYIIEKKGSTWIGEIELFGIKKRCKTKGEAIERTIIAIKKYLGE